MPAADAARTRECVDEMRRSEVSTMAQGDQELLGNTGVRWSSESIHKAEKVIEDGKIREDSEHDDVWWVRGSSGSTEYRVQTDGRTWLMCTCPNGMRAARPSCYHAAAALMLLQDRKDSE